MNEFRILSATAILGYGFPLASFEEGMRRKPSVIAADAGSTDPGPFYLGAGVSFTDRDAVKRDLEIMLVAGVSNNIPVVVGTAGGSGAAPHLAWCRDIIEEIAHEKGLSFKMAVIHADIDKGLIKAELSKGNVVSLGSQVPLSDSVIDKTTHVVGQMGMEPFLDVLDHRPDVILAGRTYDPVCFAAHAVYEGYDLALSLHLGKILECAAICATPGSGSDCMFGYVGEDYFRIEPLNPIRRCTVLSVAAHTLYEKTNPYILKGPGGHLDLHDTKFVQESDSVVRVSGTRFVHEVVASVKLEGAMPRGFRTVSIAGVRDPVFIENVDEIVSGVKERVRDNFADRLSDYSLLFHIYGRDGVMGDLEPSVSTSGVHELGIVIEATAASQKEADTVCSFARSTMLHYGYEGRRSTAGNLAFPYSPSDLLVGEVFVFSIYHLLKHENPAELFKSEIVEL